MTVLLAGLGLLLFAFFVHVVIWRLALPRGHTSALLTIFTAVPIVFLCVAFFAAGFQMAASDILRLALFYASLALMYIVIYSAIEMESATLSIVSFVARAGAAGRTEEELSLKFGRGATIEGRLKEMERGGWIFATPDRLTLTARGKFYATLFDGASTVFGLSKGG